MKTLRLHSDPPPRPVETFPVWSAEEILGNGTQARIVLGDQVYTLRLTRAGKLILTK